MTTTDVWLSPHHDDVCFSLAASVNARGGGELVNLCPRCIYVAAPGIAGESPADRLRRVTLLRTAEDKEFAAGCGLNRQDLPFETPPVRGVHPFDLRPLQAQVERFRGTLLGAIADIARRHAPVRLTLFCPLGIGGHGDHVAMFVVIAQALPSLARFCNVHFYEDLYYASHPVVRRAGIARAATVLRGAPLRRHVHALSAEAMAKKMELVRIYASQHRAPPDPARFSPADTGVGGPHEAVWSFPGRAPGHPFAS